MHQSVREWAHRVITEHDLAARDVLEVGALNVNGSLRDLFTGYYLGTDMREGSGVDRVCDAHGLWDELPGRWFEVVVCTEMLEHDSAPWVSMVQMYERLCSGGLLLLTARGYDTRGCFPVHDYPEDHWRFSVTGMTHLLAFAGFTPLEVIPDPEAPGVFALARA